MNDQLIDTFKAVYESLAGHVHVVDGIAQAATALCELLGASGARTVALGTLPEALTSALTDYCADRGIEILTPPYRSEDLPGCIDRAGVGVTAAAFAIAETGTLAEAVPDDAERLVSSLPRLHLGVVRQGDIVASLYDAAPRMRALLSEPGSHSAISFISGPSRTGDIEMILTLGVHGPEEAHAIVVKEPADG